MCSKKFQKLWAHGLKDYNAKGFSSILFYMVNKVELLVKWDFVLYLDFYTIAFYFTCFTYLPIFLEVDVEFGKRFPNCSNCLDFFLTT